MAKMIGWETGYDAAVKKAQEKGKALVIDFFSPT